ncbi:MAG: diguanylate cyclase [Gemmatimonadales bacterium]|nr:MAG: diguanylate cyclase [Gemmatimonadales bacterium]
MGWRGACLGVVGVGGVRGRAPDPTVGGARGPYSRPRPQILPATTVRMLRDDDTHHRTQRFRFRAVALGLLLLPALVVLLTDPQRHDIVFVWWLGVLPVVLTARTDGWRGAMVMAFGVVLLAVLAHTGVAATTGQAVSPILPPVLIFFLLAAAAIAWLARAMGDDRGDVEDLALTDRLTGLPNRRHARVFLETMFGSAERGRPLAVVLFDLDDFSGVNEAEGIRGADRILVEFADLLRSNTRRMNLSSRFGGEEFLAILAGGDEEGARAFAERIREAFRAAFDETHPTTLSAGVAAYHPSMKQPAELVAAADLALGRAKDEGGDRIRVFGRDVGSEDVRRSREQGSTAPRTPEAYISDPASMGNRPPPPDLIPEPSARFGEGRTILLVEHDSGEREVFDSYLEQEAFEVTSVEDAQGAIQALRSEFDAVFIDLQLPGLSSSELVRAVKSRWPATQVVVITADRDARVAAEALNAGADRYLFRPVDMPELQSALVDALARRDRLRAEEDRRREDARQRGAIVESGDNLVVDGLLALAEAAERRDHHSRGHARRVADYAVAIAGGLASPPEEFDPDRLHLACLVHNLGMISVPSEILNKSGTLTPEEFERVRRHPEVGRRILEPALGDEVVLQVAGWHHERWDGSGYPDGLAGEAIPLAARIVSIADALDAMTSTRPYRKALTWEDAVRQVRDRAGTHFDPGLLPAFRSALPELYRRFRQAPPTTADGDPDLDLEVAPSADQ